MIKIRTVQIIDLQDWDKLVTETYKRPYSFQQQDGCKSRGMEELNVPSLFGDDFENDTVPEIVNDPEMGVSFAAWLARDPSKLLESDDSKSSLRRWWDRNFYPHIDAVADDLHSKGLLPAGKYLINIDW